MDKVNKLVAILGGETTIAVHLEFLIRNNHADLLILKNTKVGKCEVNSDLMCLTTGTVCLWSLGRCTYMYTV